MTIDPQGGSRASSEPLCMCVLVVWLGRDTAKGTTKSEERDGRARTGSTNGHIYTAWTETAKTHSTDGINGGDRRFVSL